MIYPFYWYQKPMHYISFICKVFKRSLHLLLLIKPNWIITYIFFFFFANEENKRKALRTQDACNRCKIY